MYLIIYITWAPWAGYIPGYTIFVFHWHGNQIYWLTWVSPGCHNGTHLSGCPRCKPYQHHYHEYPPKYIIIWLIPVLVMELGTQLPGFHMYGKPRNWVPIVIFILYFYRKVHLLHSKSVCVHAGTNCFKSSQYQLLLISIIKEHRRVIQL